MKRSTSRYLILTFIIIAVFALVLSCAAPAPTPTPTPTPTPPPAPKEPVKIGVIIELTGGIANPQCAEGPVTALNLYGKTVAGRPVEIIIEDSASDPAKGLEKAKKLVETDKVQFIMGPIHAAGVLAVGDYCTKMNVPLVTYVPSITYVQKADPKLNLGRVFMFGGAMNFAAYYVGKYMYQKGFRKIVTIGSDYIAGYSYINPGANSFVEAGGKILQMLWIPMGETEVAPYIAKLDKSADAIMWWIAGPTGPVIQKTLIDYGIKLPLYRVDGAEYTNDQVLAKAPYAEGHRFGCTYMYTVDTPLNKKMVDQWLKDHGRYPEQHAANLCMGIQIILQTVEALGGKTDADSFAKKLAEKPYETARGPVKFNEDGTIVSNVYIGENKKVNGVLTPLVIDVVPNCDVKVGNMAKLDIK